MQQTPDICIQIVNYQSVELLDSCLKSVLADLEQAKFSWIIYVLDNASGDDFVVLESNYPDVKFSVSPKNVGFGAGHNQISSLVQATYRLILNPDTELQQPNTIQRLMSVLIEQEEIGIVGPRLITKDGSTQYWDHGEIYGWKAKVAAYAGGSTYRHRTVASNVAWVSGACFIIKDTCFRQVSGFDEEFFLYKEEEDLSIRVRTLGLSIWYDPSIAVYHLGGGSGASKSKHSAISNLYFGTKHATNPLIKKIAVWAYQKYRLWE